MKLTVTAFLLSATAVFAGPTENITGCATVPVEGSNYTVRADVNCALAENKDGSAFIFAGLAGLVEDDEDEAAK